MTERKKTGVFLTWYIVTPVLVCGSTKTCFYLLYFGRVILSSIQMNHLIQSPFVALSAYFFLFEGKGLQPLRHGKLPLGITIRYSL